MRRKPGGGDLQFNIHMLGGTVEMVLELGVKEAGDLVGGLEDVGEEEILTWAGGDGDHLFVRYVDRNKKLPKKEAWLNSTIYTGCRQTQE